ncbi:MAG: SDR family NAD(P)-dependent oxidoreductase [Ilumatobacter sp.]|uniref:type I polyketide synthase n=1 Tax=Ilumatobacter sp. TaxID=1967498 RepID=UPI0026182E3F|nr:type I polyketide synthase [Ilumatobacter sp.]MDJ0768066.1 SDR family NAD(P)-dependent oxidoreductase [Ilumatobacter sp.]
MPNSKQRAIAIVGVGAVLPDAPDAPTFWENLKQGRYSISEVDTERWDPSLYFDDDRQATGKTYSKIGGWVKDFEWKPLEWRLPIPPKVSDAMDRTQKWAVKAAREALLDYGYPDRALDTDRTAVVIGNAMGGDLHYHTALPVYHVEFADELEKSPAFAGLPAETRQAIHDEYRTGIHNRFPGISEDTMPGELANIIAGRIANLFNLHGPNFTTDAACASAMAAVDAAIEGLEEGDFDAVITGGVDANMSASTFVKFCKIGALSATGTRPYGNGADGFIMGEGAALFVLKRLEDAEAAGDRIYAVIRGLGGASDGKGKGITAPNPVGQTLAVQRAWRNAGLVPGPATYIEGHGTSTKVGDVVEVNGITDAFSDLDLPIGSIPLGSVKSNIGHLKGAAGAAGMLKVALSLHHKTLPPSLGATDPNPNIDFGSSPLAVNTDLTEWKTTGDQVRAGGVSAFGFGGTNFHAVLEEYVPGRIESNGGSASIAVSAPSAVREADEIKTPLRGALVIGDRDESAVLERLRAVQAEAAAGRAPEPGAPAQDDLDAEVRIAIDYGDADELAARAAKAIAAFEGANPAAWKLLRNQGVFLGRGAPHQVAFLYTGQGSQYVNMLADLRAAEPIVARGFAEADAVMEPILGRPLTEVIFVDPSDDAALAEADEQLRQTEITQPAVLTVDRALTEVLGAYGIHADMVMGHSLGEYGALVAAGALPFAHALEAVAARGREMANVSVDDNGLMAAVFAPLDEIERTIDATDGYVVVANNNSSQQAVIGGASAAVQAAVDALSAAGHTAVLLPVSHAFHTAIVAPAAEPLKVVLGRLDLETPHIPIVANVDGEFYPSGPAVVPEMIEMLGRQVASPVQFIKGLNTLYDAGARTFVEVGPKRALHGFVDDVLGEHDDIVNLYTNHPKAGDVVSFNQALCGLYAAGHGVGTRPHEEAPPTTAPAAPAAPASAPVASAPVASAAASPPRPVTAGGDSIQQLGELFANFLDQGYQIYRGASGGQPAAQHEPVVVTGAALGLPGTEEVFDDANIERLLNGESFIDVIPVDLRNAIVDKHITRLVKNEAGGGTFEEIDSAHDVMKLAGRKGHFDIVEQFGLPPERKLALDPATELAIGAGIDALRDAGVPMTMRYKTTSTGSKLPDGWALPSALADDTGVIFASAFPGADRMVDEITRYEEDRARRARLHALEHLRDRMEDDNPVVAELDHMIHELEVEIETHRYQFDRRFLFKALSMGHSQFAEHIGARGPNTQINSACASTTQAVAIAEDWIRLGRCNRVLIIAGDDVTTDVLMDWVGAGFLATGAAATDEIVEEAALPFDRRRHGMLLGMGGAAIVVEGAASARGRGIRPICDVLSTETANSAFHGSRLDVTHIRDVMERLVRSAETKWGVERHAMAASTVFVSHETYTPARGGSAQAEVDALRHVFGDSADRIVVANTKGFTGHAMGVGIEDVLAVKALETGIVPPIANVKEIDPDLGHLTLSKGGAYPVSYALRLGAGFGSQISMSLMRWVPNPDGRHREPDELGIEYRIADHAAWTAWLQSISGYDGPELEVDHRVLRVRDDGPPTRIAVPSRPEVATAPPVLTAPPVETVQRPAPAPAPAATPAAAAPAATPTPAPAAAPVAPAAPEVVADPVEAVVLGIVAEQTGYPSDMLDLELDLEADLGIDTVKQAETFAAIREHYDIERDDTLSLRDYPTLASVIDFVHERATNLAADDTAAATAPAAGDAEPATMHASVVGDDEAAAGIARRNPTPVIRPPLDACVPTGIELGAGTRVVVMLDEGGVGAALADRLGKRGADVLTVEGAPDADELLTRIDEWRGDESVTGIYWLPALDVEPPVGDLDLAGWREALRHRVKLLYRTLRHLYEQVGTPGGFLVSATRLGGLHGYGPDGATAPMGGGVVGITKAFKRERPDTLVKAVDFGVSRKTAALADVLIDETLTDPGIVEVGHRDDQRYTITLRENDMPEPATGLTLDGDSVFVITGAAGSIVSAIITDLGQASGGTFHLLDLVPEPDPADPDIIAFDTDREALKRTIFERLTADGQKATPVMVDRELAKLERAHEALSAIQAVRAAGGTVHYHSVNLLDADAMAAVTESISETSGKVDALIHAGGLEISRLLPDKEPSEYDLVFDVKADGWFNLMHGLGHLPIGATVAFSSIAGRFGNGGQTDYSAANDLLCKLTANMKLARPETFGIAVDWTAWGDIGMATRGSIPTVMAAAGIDMLPAAAGIPIVRRELTGDGSTREMVAGKQLGILAEELHPTGGLDTEAMSADLAARPLLDELVGFAMQDGLVAMATLDPTEEPFLFDHRIDGTPVLPGVMGLELFAQTATIAFPDLHLAALEDVDFLAPFKFYRDEPRTLLVSAQYVADGDDVVAECRLVGERTLANQDQPQRTIHFTGRVRLTRQPVEEATAQVPGDGGPSVSAGDVYEIYFHGPAYQVLDASWLDAGQVVGRLHGDLPAERSSSEGELATAPRLTELCFQTAGVWEIGTTDQMALPMHLDRVVPLGGPGDETWAVVVPGDAGSFDATVVDGSGRVLARLEGYRTVALPGALADEQVAPLRAAMTDGR